MPTKLQSAIRAAAFALLVTAPTVALASTGTPPSIIAMGQRVRDAIVVTYAYMPKDGYLVIHPSDSRGKASENVLGQVELTKGAHRDVKVKLKKEVTPDEKLWAELQTKPGAAGSTHPISDDGTPIVESFMTR